MGSSTFKREAIRRALGGVLAAGLVLWATVAQAEVLRFMAELTAASQVPPNGSPAIGRAEFLFDTDTAQLTYTVVYDGLTGVATAAHIHGPAAPGSNAGVIVPFQDPASPIAGTATLQPAAAAALVDGMLYVNVHTAANKDGEIRGQITKRPVTP